MKSSWQFFMVLETTAEVTVGFGSVARNWNVANALGKPWIDLPRDLRDDLLLWKRLLNIGESIKRKRVKDGKDG